MVPAEWLNAFKAPTKTSDRMLFLLCPTVEVPVREKFYLIVDESRRPELF